MNKVRIKILEDSHYTIRRLYRQKINIYNIEYTESGNIYTISEDDLDKIVLDDIEILSFKGYKSFLYKIKSNMHFLISLIISIVLMFVLSNVVLKVDVIHSDRKVRELVKEELIKYNVHPFMFKKSFDNLQRIKNQIKDDYPENIEWLEIIDNGMKYTVRVEERIITEKTEEPEYCDIISNKDAIVLGIVSSEGQNLVLMNDFVKKGSTLVSGAIKFNEEVKAYTCAEGEVYGNTWYTVSVSVPYDYVSKKYTGKTKKNIAFEIGSKYTEIFKVHLDKYDTDKKSLFSIWDFTMYDVTHREYIEKNSRYKEEEALEVALEKGREKILVNLDDDASILSEKVLQRNAYDSIIEVDIFYSVREKISEKVTREKPKEEEGVKRDEST